jgi:hypothetical protein
MFRISYRPPEMINHTYYWKKNADKVAERFVWICKATYDGNVDITNFD